MQFGTVDLHWLYCVAAAVVHQSGGIDFVSGENLDEVFKLVDAVPTPAARARAKGGQARCDVRNNLIVCLWFLSLLSP